MKLREIFWFEAGRAARRVSTWAYFALYVFLTWMMVSDVMIDEARGSGNVHANAPVMIAVSMVLLSMIGMVVTAAIFGDAASRDVQARMHPLFYTSPLRKIEYLGGRFLGAFFVNALLLALVPIGLCLWQFPSFEPELFGPFRLDAFLQPFFVFSLPNLFISAALMFTASALTGRAMASYLVGAVLFVGCLGIEEGVAEALNQGAIATLLEPFGFTAMSEMAQYWTPADRNTRLVPVEGMLLWNRLAWLALAVAALTFLYYRFRASAKVERQALSLPAVRRAESPPLHGMPVPQSFTFPARLRQTLDVAKRSFADLFANRWALLAVPAILGFVVVSGWDTWMVLDTPTWPVTYVIARWVIGALAPLVYLLIAVCVGELVWKERDAGTSEIADAAPLPNWVQLAGKFLAVVAGIAALQAVLLGGGMLLQLLKGYSAFELPLYLKLLFGMQLADYVLWATLALLVHVLVDHKYLGHVVFVLYFAFVIFAREVGALHFEHNMTVFSATPRWIYSDMSGFGPFLGPWLWFKLYWGAWALLFAVVANLFWRRGRESGVLHRLRTARMRVSGPAAVGLTIAALLVLGVGGFVFYNTNVLNEYRSSDAREAHGIAYERRYKRYENLPQPRIAHCDLRVEIYPRRRAADLAGTYLLENRTQSPIGSVHVMTHRAIDVRSLSFDRAATRVHHDRDHRYSIFALKQAMRPGESLRLSFDLAFAPRGFANHQINAEVVRNGTYFDRDWLPIIGYQPEFEITSDEARKKHGLPPRDRLPSVHDPNGRQVSSHIRDADWIGLDAVIGTDADEIALAPGSLRKTWTRGGRRWFHYRTDAPIQNNFALFSAAYAVRRDRWKNVDIEVLHHPKHAYNVDMIVRGIKATLDYHTRAFGPYPHRQVRIVEFPRHAGTYARAYPNTIAYSEGFGFIARPEEGIDYPFLVTAHEVSHQWWGNQVRPARVAGGPVLGETLAHYGALMVMEDHYPAEPLHRFRDLLLHKYLIGRQNRHTEEVPLLHSNDQKYIHYDKGALVMYALRDAIGEERVNTALRRLFEKHRFGGAPYPTTLDLYAELKAVTRPPMQPLLKDLFEDITLWELRTKDARVEPAGNGAYRVTLDVEAYKVKADSIGRDRRVPMDDLVEIGVFAVGKPLYLRKHRIRSGVQTITVVVPRAPERVGIDPDHKLIERQREDNFSELPGKLARRGL